ncbi:hypothetical protein V1477_013060 [Vespula maculifrons]|uniref:Uncharacterized protein n=2 Tax=Vespula TaxID=7451 RepID=A0A834JUC7_VESVU|nr:hypothetical protein HZH66_008982 [Vespula vulgaris]
MLDPREQSASNIREKRDRRLVGTYGTRVVRSLATPCHVRKAGWLSVETAGGLQGCVRSSQDSSKDS